MVGLLLGRRAHTPAIMPRKGIFFDPDKEPDRLILQEYDRPSLGFLQAHPSILTNIYKNDDPKMIVELFATGRSLNFEAEGANLLMYQKITGVLSYTMWLICLLIYGGLRKYNRK